LIAVRASPNVQATRPGGEQMRAFVGTCACITAVLVGQPAFSEEPAPRPIHQVEPITRKALTDYLTAHAVDFKPTYDVGETHRVLLATGLSARRTDIDGVTSATECAGGGNGWTLKGAVLSVRCVMECTTTFSGNIDPTPPPQHSSESVQEEYRILALSKDALVLSSGGTRWLSDCAEQACVATRFLEPLVEIIPGAADKTLLDAVRRALRQPKPLGVVFEGPPAKKPRVVSEVFFTTGYESEAKEIAEALSKVIGPVVPAPWPGEWAFDVVVVVGAKVAGQ